MIVSSTSLVNRIPSLAMLLVNSCCHCGRIRQPVAPGSNHLQHEPGCTLLHKPACHLGCHPSPYNAPSYDMLSMSRLTKPGLIACRPQCHSGIQHQQHIHRSPSSSNITTRQSGMHTLTFACELVCFAVTTLVCWMSSINNDGC